jgi:arylsulfatase A-like enzyme
MDPHGPYEPPDAYASHYTDAYPTKTVRLRDIPEYQRLTPPGAAGPTDDLNYYLASYDREIRYLDDELGRLFAALDERWGAQSGLIAFTADHGESMDEHGEYLGHGRLPFRPSTRVPLILRMPGRVPSGRRLATPVGMTSLLPTLLELVGVAVPETAQGHSLVPWIDGDAPEPDPAVFGYAGIDLPPQSFMRRGPFKLVRFTQDREIERFGGRLALYDIANDPGETRNVIRDHPAVAERMRQELEDWFEENWRRTGVASGRPIEFDEQEAEMLRQLGYGR